MAWEKMNGVCHKCGIALEANTDRFMDIRHVKGNPKNCPEYP